jgi:superfamily I DNA/RNA helicase/mRNA-degrading endonuclease RelE of RelBE toxin-antitoxin system
MVEARLALAKSFLESYSKLPQVIQKKVRRLTEKVQSDPTSSGLNFERIQQARDDKVRSLRVDRSYRLIVIQPPRGDVLLCVWVDHHDEAYEWAARKVFEVNPRSGVLQVYSVEECEGDVLPLPQSGQQGLSTAPLFDHVGDEDLLFAGVPVALLASVRALISEGDLDRLSPYLPEDCSDFLYLLAAGYGFTEAMEEATRPRPVVAVDQDDFAAAVDRPESRAAFHVVEGESALQDVLDAPFEQWRFFLHPSQQKLVVWNVNGPIRVLGGAGTGKTVVLLHRARHLMSEIFTAPGDRILVTTFTRNLAHDLRLSLEELASDQVDRMEVRNLHAWARAFYEERVGARLRVLESEAKRRELMEQALLASVDEHYTAAFYLEEWDRVVQAQGIADRTAYFRARRVGRGTRLTRKERSAVWKVLEEYRRLLDVEHLMEWQDVIREVRLYIESHEVISPYRAVLADEVQDFSREELLLLRALAPVGANDMFLVGDAHQRIYGGMTRLSACGIEIRGRSSRLKINYRTTEQIRNQAVVILHGLKFDDLDGQADSMQGYRSLRSGPPPRVHCFSSQEQEFEHIRSQIETWFESTPPEEICLAARTHDLVQKYSRAIRAAGIDLVEIKTTDSPRRKGVRVATMHRLKGLEFRRVLLCGVHESMVPLRLPAEALGDGASQEDFLRMERCLLYVASTRARDELVITGHGAPSPFLREGNRPSLN